MVRGFTDFDRYCSWNMAGYTFPINLFLDANATLFGCYFRKYERLVLGPAGRSATMTNWFWYLICMLAGLILGIIYFTWLRQCTEMLAKNQDTHTWLFHRVSRFGLLMICFYLLSGNCWQNWVSCLIGWTSTSSLVVLQVLRQLGSTTGSAK